MEDFSKYAIKDYKYWQVQIHPDQSHLGRCVIWCLRKEAEDLAGATPEEQTELFQILKDLCSAITQAFQANWFNYSFLGNKSHHLHGHFIPRYESPREFAGITFTDEQWGHNPYKGPKKDFVTSPELLEQVQTKLKKVLR